MKTKVEVLGYEIEIDGLIIDCGTDNEYIHQNLLPNTKHTYRVRSKNEYGIGNWSELIEKLTLPDIPVNLAVVTMISVLHSLTSYSFLALSL